MTVTVFLKHLDSQIYGFSIHVSLYPGFGIPLVCFSVYYNGYLLFIKRGKATVIKRIHLDGCRYNEILNSKTEGSQGDWSDSQETRGPECK